MSKETVIACVYHSRTYHILTENGITFHIPKYFNEWKGFVDSCEFPGGRIKHAQAMLDLYNDAAKDSFKKE